MSPEKVLVVDDDADVAELIKLSFQRVGFAVTTAGDGEEAWEKIQSDMPHYVVCDVMMPKVDGFELVKRIKTTPSTKHISVVMLTARAADADVFKGWQFGADEYLTKPFKPDQLVSIINAIIKSKANETRAKLKGKYVIGDGN